LKSRIYPFILISQIIIPSQPFDLRPGVPVNDIALVVLKTPGDHDYDIAVEDPDFFLIFPLIRPRRVTRSLLFTRMWFAPIISSAIANISQFRFRGSRTLMISSPGVPEIPVKTED
jgi:hypothetical protein